MLAITVGQGVDKPHGELLYVDPAVASVARAIAQQPRATERWWAGSVFRGNYRESDRWLALSVVPIDLDYHLKRPVMPSVAEREQLVEIVTSGRMPGSLFHLTPHGARVAFVLGEPCSDRHIALTAAKTAGHLVAAAIDGTAYRVDWPFVTDLAHLFYTPHCRAKGEERDDQVVELRHELYSVAALAAQLPAETPTSAPARTTHRRVSPITTTLADATSAWNADHPLELRRHSADCPVCGHRGCFGRLPGDEQRWTCFSTNHPDVGLVAANGSHHGDALDLEAHARGCKPVDVLRKDGYLTPRASRPLPPAATPPATDGNTALDVTPIESVRPGVLRNNSYLAVLTLVRGNLRDVLGPGARLEFDEMAGRVTFNRRPIEDVDETRVRSEIERCFSGGVDKNGNQTGMQQKLGDVRQAMQQIARERPFHPVREYLSGLTWDGVPRLDAVAEDILGAERTVLNQALVRRYLVSAVARAMVPGCKVDTALILVGKTGVGKSRFFRTLAEPWFLDSLLDVTSTKGMMTIRRAWIYEWAELEVMRRAEDINTVKAWISSPTDEYVPQYGHHPVEVPRSFVIAGTTEVDDFLVDEKGNRRFWPLKVTTVDLAALRAQRDQLWAEAKVLYDAWDKQPETTPWVLSAEESAALDSVHGDHQESDSWTDLVVPWAEKQCVEFTTSDVLEHAVKKLTAQRGRGDDMRIAKILKRAGWRLGKKPVGRSRPWVRGPLRPEEL